MKTYYVGYEREKGKFINLLSLENAEQSGMWYKVIEASSYVNAKEQVINFYLEENQEHEQ